MGILSDNKRDTTFLAKDDCPGPGKAQGMLADIVSFEMVDLNPNGRTPEMKPILKTKEHSPMVLNPTNRDWLLDRFGDDQRCIGNTILIWHDPDVEYPRGTKVGGLRIADSTEYRRDQGKDVAFDDDIPFGDRPDNQRNS